MVSHSSTPPIFFPIHLKLCIPFPTLPLINSGCCQCQVCLRIYSPPASTVYYLLDTGRNSNLPILEQYAWAKIMTQDFHWDHVDRFSKGTSSWSIKFQALGIPSLEICSKSWTRSSDRRGLLGGTNGYPAVCLRILEGILWHREILLPWISKENFKLVSTAHHPRTGHYDGETLQQKLPKPS
jgi:hypothetical protein